MAGLGVPCGPVNTLDQVFADPRCGPAACGIDMPHASAAGGTVPMVANPLKMSATPPCYRHGPPTLGQHTDEVLVELLGLGRRGTGAVARGRDDRLTLSAGPGRSVAQEFAERRAGDPAIDLRPVMAGAAREDPRAVLDAAALGILGTEIDPPQPGEARRCGAHRARLQRDVEIAAHQPWRARLAARRPDHQNLGMGGRICALLDPVAVSRQQGAVRGHDDGTHRHLARAGRGLGFLQRQRHGLHGLGSARPVERDAEVARFRRRRRQLHLEPAGPARLQRRRGRIEQPMIELAPVRVQHRHAHRRHFARCARSIADLPADHQHGPALAQPSRRAGPRSSMPRGSSRTARAAGRAGAAAGSSAAITLRAARAAATSSATSAATSQATKRPRGAARVRALGDLAAASTLVDGGIGGAGEVNGSTNQRSLQLEHRTVRPVLAQRGRPRSGSGCDSRDR